MKLHCKGCVKHSEKDIFGTGCTGEYDSQWIKLSLYYCSQDEAISECKAFAGVDNDECVEINACGEDGRVDIQTLEDTDGYPLSPSQIEKWKAGEINAFACTYSFTFEQIIPFKFI